MIRPALLAAVALATTPSDADRDQLRAYVGRNMWEPLSDAPGFLGTRLVQRGIARLDRADRRALGRLQVGSPVMSEADFVFTTLCRSHCCPCEHAVVAVDVVTGEIALGLWQGRVTWVWRGQRSRGTPQAIPCGIVTAFYNPTMPVPPEDGDRCSRTVPLP
jgi:hypothetical protein